MPRLNSEVLIQTYMLRILLFMVAIHGLLFNGSISRSVGQCLSTQKLITDLQKISTQSDMSAQERALQTWRQHWEHCQYPPDSTYINGLLQLGYAQFCQGNYTSATQVVKQAVKLSQVHRADISLDQQSKALYRLGVLYSMQDQQADVLKTLEQAIKQGQHVASASKWVGNSHLYLAYTYYSSGDYQPAIYHAEIGVITANSLNDSILLAKLLQEKAKAYNRLKLYEQAKRAAEQAVNIAQADKRMATILIIGYSLLGTIEENQQQTIKALYYQRQAFTIACDTKDSYAPIFAVQLGRSYYRLERYDEAIPYFEFGAKYNTDLFDKANSFSNLGAVYWKKKEFKKAFVYYHKSLITMPIGYKKTTVESLPSAQSIRQASQKDYLLSLIQDKADTWLDYAKVDHNRQRFQYALETYKVADQMIDLMRWEHTGQQSKLYWRQKTQGMYERAIETCFLLKNTEQAFRFFEKSRAAMLADKLNELGARQQLSPQQAKEEQLLQQHVSNQQAKLATITSSKPMNDAAYKTAQLDLDIEQDKLDAFRKKLETSNPVYFRIKYDTTVTSLADLRSHLKTQKASFVTYFVGDSALYVLGVTADTSMLLQQPLRSYQQNVRAFIGLLANPDSMNRKSKRDRFLALGNGLYNQLLAPLKLPTGRLIVSSDGSFVPFETLSRKADEPDYLVNEYAFTYTYSARLLLKKYVGNTIKTTNQTFFGIAPVTFAPSLKQVGLPGSEEALKLIAGRFQSPTLLTHKAATRRAFLTKAADASVIHLFTHATADSSGQEPMLYFADSTLKLSDLGDGALPNAQLVVLAACKTGIGAVQRGEGVFSLARGFAALGVPSVLTTLWSVQSNATYELTDLFYKYLDEGLPKDIALQRAKQDWLKTSEGINQLPNFWAGLIIVGDAEPLVRTNHSLWIAVGSFLALGALGIWFWRRQKRIVRHSLQTTT